MRARFGEQRNERRYRGCLAAKIGKLRQPAAFAASTRPLTAAKDVREAQKRRNDHTASPNTAEPSPFISFDFLDLPDCRTIWRGRLEHMLLVRASYERFPSACPRCDAQCLRAEPPRTLVFWDVPHLGQPTLVQLFVSDATCLICGTFLKTEPEWLHPSRDMSLRMIDFIKERMATQLTITQVALDSGLDVQTVIDIFIPAFRKWDVERVMALPAKPGIDEAHFPRKVIRTLIVDSEGPLGTVDVLEDRTNATIAKRLRAAPNAKDILDMTMDFTGPFRDAAKKPLDTVSGSKRSTDEDEEPFEAGTFDTPLFGEMPKVNVTAAGHDEYILEHPEEVAPPLPNMQAVADHFHFAQYVVKGFRASWSFVRASLEDLLVQEELEKLSEQTIADLGRESAEAHARARVAADFEKVKSALWEHRYAMCAGGKRRAKQSQITRSEIEGLLSRLPLLKSAWEAKNVGLNIFPHKQRPSRSKQVRMAANAEGPSPKPVLDIDVQEVERKLDDWVQLICSDDQMKSFFGEALKVIAEWRPELLRIATTGLNNARAEAKVAEARTLNRIARGQQFDLFRARLLWLSAFRRTNRWPKVCDAIDGRITGKRVFEMVDAMEALGKEASPSAPTNRSDVTLKSVLPVEPGTSQTDDQRRSASSEAGADEKTLPKDQVAGKKI